MSLFEFWEMTPIETLEVIRAQVCRFDQQRRMMVAQAWQIAALTRTKRLPSLKSLLVNKGARVLSGDELEQRRSEFKEMTQGVDISSIMEERFGNHEPTG